MRGSTVSQYGINNSSRYGLAGLLFAGAAINLVFWVLYFGGLLHIDTTRKVVISYYESAFPFADILLGLVMIIGGVGLLRFKDYGRHCLLIASSMIVYLGMLDVTFYARHGLYLPLGVSSIFEIFLNIVCIAGGI
ncbi:MAG: hypothetical protein AB1746_07320, partial [Candidatus Zixiibacteriota bacterium]